MLGTIAFVVSLIVMLLNGVNILLAIIGGLGIGIAVSVIMGLIRACFRR